MKIEVSNNQTNWTTAAENTDGSVYAWKNVSVAAVGKYIRITSMCDDLAINEFALKKTDGTGFATLTAVSGNAWQLTDEQNTVPLYPSYMNSTYFDEIYHARTAYEHILDSSHTKTRTPRSASSSSRVGIRIFGMTRSAGASGARCSVF